MRGKHDELQWHQEQLSPSLLLSNLLTFPPFCCGDSRSLSSLALWTPVRSLNSCALAILPPSHFCIPGCPNGVCDLVIKCVQLLWEPDNGGESVVTGRQKWDSRKGHCDVTVLYDIMSGSGLVPLLSSLLASEAESISCLGTVFQPRHQNEQERQAV